MTRSADRVQVEIRCEGWEEEYLTKVISDIDTVTDSNGRSLVVEIVASSEASPEAPLVVAGPDDETTMLAAVEDGALGYITVSSSPEDVEAAIATVAEGAAVIPPMMLGALLRHTVQRRRAVAEIEARLVKLTDREREVVEQLAMGKQRREIAHQLFISPDTVRTHIQRAMAKLEVHSQNELMALLAPLEQGLP